MLQNLGLVLEELGADFGDVVRTNVYLEDIGDFDAVNAVYREFFSEPFPARTTVAVRLRGILVEIDAVAEIPLRRNPLESSRVPHAVRGRPVGSNA